MTARLQHQPASSRATATAITVERFLRACMLCQRWCRRRSAAWARARTAGLTRLRRAVRALLGARNGRWCCQAVSTSNRRAWVLPVLVIEPWDRLAPLEDSEGTSPR